MDWLTFSSNVLKFVSDLVGSLAWPGLVVFLLFRFRAEIRPLVGEIGPLVRKLTSLKLGAVEAKFALDTEKALSDIQAAPSHESVPTPARAEQFPLPTIEEPSEPHPLPSASSLSFGSDPEPQFADSVDDDWPSTLEFNGVGDDSLAPRNSAVIAMAWRDVEGSIDKLAKAIGNRFPYNKLYLWSKLKAIEHAGVLEPRFVQALRSLQKLRNEVVHTPGFEPTDESTTKYLEGVRSARIVLKDAVLEARKLVEQ